MKSRSLVKVLFLAAAVSPAFAQIGPPPGGPRPGFRGGEGPGGPGGFGPHAGKVITGAPYSADVSNSVVQTLTDGNSIQRTTTGHVAVIEDRAAATTIFQRATGRSHR